jgi:hypothetical protein
LLLLITIKLNVFKGQSSVQATGASPAADQSSASAAAAQASTTGFTIPGKTLQVLPIGLGVFAGISVIALIVVGLVTYERTKYRKVTPSIYDIAILNTNFITDI